ncbi:MAG TPA: hypothetical protein IAB83_04605 [Candidatus Faecousia faecavium]|nr:hypothetical protein [Candidatus Faecousia faecavium]
MPTICWWCEAAEFDRAAAEAEIRYALSLLLDRNYIVEEITQGGQVPASSFAAMGMTDADGSQFYENAGHSEDYVGYYNTAKEAFEANYDQLGAQLRHHPDQERELPWR